jgi:glycosyltransferase involved in cell wall biosynthesis
MTERPKLSICVPSRNRQDTFRQTIADLIANPRTDVEFVFADNSDDPAIMNAFMADVADPRIRYLPAPPETLPMQDNWERTMEAATGAWIVFIGDDDYVDPDVADIIGEIVRRQPATEAIGWNRPGFKWPSYRPFPGNLNFSLRNDVISADRATLVRKMFRWEGSSYVPTVPFTVYHGAVSRPVMEKIRRRHSGRYFEHPTVDFDCGNKLLFTARNFVFVNRPLSILGATEKSNSAAVGRYARALEIYDTFVREKGNRFETGGAMDDFPFKSFLGVAASIMSAQHWFKARYKIRIDGWEENFIRALALDCSRAIDRTEFDMHVELCRRAISGFAKGRYMHAFAPRFTGGAAGMFTGMNGTVLYVDERIGGCRTPAELYGLLQSMMEPMSALKYAFGEERLVDAA